MSQRKKPRDGVGAVKAALDRFEAVWKRTKRIPPSHADLRTGTPRLKQGSEKHIRAERDER